MLFLVWAVVALALFGWQMAAYVACSRRLRSTAREVSSPELLAACRTESERLGLRRQIPLMQSPLADSPMLVGILRPVLLLPAESLPAEAAPMVLR